MTSIGAHLADLGSRFVLFGQVIGIGMICSAVGLLAAGTGSDLLGYIAATVTAVAFGTAFARNLLVPKTIISSPRPIAALKVKDLKSIHKPARQTDVRKNSNDLNMSPPRWFAVAFGILIPQSIRSDFMENLSELYDRQINRLGRGNAITWLVVQLFHVSTLVVLTRLTDFLARILAKLR